MLRRLKEPTINHWMQNYIMGKWGPYLKPALRWGLLRHVTRGEIINGKSFNGSK